jgi:putative flippase GtrA
MTNPTIAALIPANGPTDALPKLAQALRARGLLVVVTVDGGEAECDAVFDSCAQNARVIRLPERAGRGAAIRAGVACAREELGNCVVVTADAEGNNAIDDILRVAGIAQENPGTLILGARARCRNRAAALALRLLYRAFAKLDVHDLTTGLRAFDASLFHLIEETPGERDECEMNVLLKCAKEKIPIVETKIETVCPDGGAGTLLSAFRHYLRVYGNMIKFSLSSFAGFLTDYAMFNLLYALTPAMGEIRIDFSNYVARAISATLNYAINRRLVFKSRENVARTAVQYFVLAAIILIFNTKILDFLIDKAHFNAQIAKLLTELMFFLMSWLAQRFIIFRKKRAEAK